jgi:2,4-dichlorophenol 6-monooxygenase
VVGKGRFALLTGISGGEWADAAAEVSAELGIPIAAHVIGPGREYTDLYDDWARLREVAENGCVLVRPDAHVGWRAHTRVDDAAAELRRALELILDRSESSEERGEASAVSEPSAAA